MFSCPGDLNIDPKKESVYISGWIISMEREWWKHGRKPALCETWFSNCAEIFDSEEITVFKGTLRFLKFINLWLWLWSIFRIQRFLKSLILWRNSCLWRSLKKFEISSMTWGIFVFVLGQFSIFVAILLLRMISWYTLGKEFWKKVIVIPWQFRQILKQLYYRKLFKSCVYC